MEMREPMKKHECMSEINYSLEEILHFALTQPNFLKTNDPYSIKLRKTCLKLISRDSECEVIDNYEHGFCDTYPMQLLIPVAEKLDADGTEVNKKVKATVTRAFRDIIPESKHGRARCRFPVPAFRAFGKNICRSSTLSLLPEMLGHLALEKVKQVYEYTRRTITLSNQDNPGGEKDVSDSDDSNNSSSESLTDPKEANIFDCARSKDKELLELFGISHIFDLMVENKKEKFGMYVTSSEKEEFRKYREFHVNSVPYPGCEHFAKYSANSRNGEELLFGWDDPQNTAKINVPSDSSGEDWSLHEQWDLVELTKKYLKVMLENIKSEDEGGILVHCISGWDRTPMYISLLRLSLWADGVIHQSLSACEMVFLTVVYDWLLFNHNFKNRVQKNEEILYFCFDFLKYITGEEFSVVKHRSSGQAQVNKVDDEVDLFAFKHETNDQVECDEDIKNGEADWFIHQPPGFDKCFVSGSPQTFEQALEVRKERLLAVREMLISAYKSAMSEGKPAVVNRSISTYLSNKLVGFPRL